MTRQLIYVGDPMCSWCWGFAPVKRAIEAQCKGRATISLLVGGLRPGTEEPVDDKLNKFLREHWEDIGQRTGQPFGFAILERDDFVYDTEPACRAAVTARTLHDDDRALAFFTALQQAFYADNADLTEPAVLADLAADAGIDRSRFAELFASDEMRSATLGDFQTARSLGVTGFPTVVACDDDAYAYLTVGYQPYEGLQPILENWLEHGFDRKPAEED
jgi:putative protein-disulfide isomerase